MFLMITIADRVDSGLVEAVARLIRQLSSSAAPEAPSLEELRNVIDSRCTQLLLARTDEGRVVGMLALTVFPVPTGLRAFIEDVVIDAESRGQGMGEALVRRALEMAASAGARTVELTSRPERLAANHLYLKLGFRQRATNSYRYTLR